MENSKSAEERLMTPVESELSRSRELHLQILDELFERKGIVLTESEKRKFIDSVKFRIPLAEFTEKVVAQSDGKEPYQDADVYGVTFRGHDIEFAISYCWDDVIDTRSISESHPDWSEARSYAESAHEVDFETNPWYERNYFPALVDGKLVSQNIARKLRAQLAAAIQDAWIVRQDSAQEHVRNERAEWAALSEKMRVELEKKEAEGRAQREKSEAADEYARIEAGGNDYLAEELLASEE